MLTPGSQNPPYVNIQRGDLVEAEWANGEFFPGIVDTIISEPGIATQVEITFNDGDHRRCNVLEVRFKDRPSAVSSPPRDEWNGEQQVHFSNLHSCCPMMLSCYCISFRCPYLVTRQWKASLVPRVCLTD